MRIDGRSTQEPSRHRPPAHLVAGVRWAAAGRSGSGSSDLHTRVEPCPEDAGAARVVPPPAATATRPWSTAAPTSSWPAPPTSCATASRAASRSWWPWRHPGWSGCARRSGRTPTGWCCPTWRELGANPARIIPAWQEFVAEHAAPGRRVRGIGEPIWAGRRRRGDRGVAAPRGAAQPGDRPGHPAVADLPLRRRRARGGGAGGGGVQPSRRRAGRRPPRQQELRRGAPRDGHVLDAAARPPARGRRGGLRAGRPRPRPARRRRPRGRCGSGRGARCRPRSGGHRARDEQRPARWRWRRAAVVGGAGVGRRRGP